MASEMAWNRKEFLDNWLDKLLLVYSNPSQVTNARTLLLRFMPEDEAECTKICETMFSYVLERNRYKKWTREKKIFYPELPNLYSFFKNQTWRDPLPSRSDFSEKEPDGPIQFCTCGQPSKQQGGLCPRCWTSKYSQGPTSVAILRDQWKKLQLKRQPGENYQSVCMKFMTGKFHILPDWMKSESVIPTDSTNSSPISKPSLAEDGF